MTAHLHETGTGTGTGEDGVNTLQAWRTGIDTHQEPVVYMRRDCPVCQSEGFTTQARVQLTAGRRSIVATLSVVDGDWLAENVAGLSESAWASLGAQPGQLVTVTHAPPLDSLSHVRAKVYGNALGDAEFSAIISDVAAGHYSDLHLATFITACAGDRLDLAETVSLTKAMIGVGDRIDWGRPLVVDKHCVGGLPGNRTTLLVVPIVAACGLTMPKTSSRAITSPAGTADTMEVLAPVNLDVRSMRRVVERTGGCIVWGGSVRLSPCLLYTSDAADERLGRLGTAQPRRRHPHPRRAAAGPGQRGPARRLGPVQEGRCGLDPCADRPARGCHRQSAQRAGRGGARSAPAGGGQRHRPARGLARHRW
ncbi:Thymidine phosphorylase [Pseudomonas aeruginosa]|nr:Thymidine phosphorylase [Pseudomonas aeruginosa]